MKKCNKCGIKKNENDFHVNTMCTNERMSVCKICKCKQEKIRREQKKKDNIYSF